MYSHLAWLTLIKLLISNFFSYSLASVRFFILPKIIFQMLIIRWFYSKCFLSRKTSDSQIYFIRFYHLKCLLPQKSHNVENIYIHSVAYSLNQRHFDMGENAIAFRVIGSLRLTIYICRWHCVSKNRLIQTQCTLRRIWFHQKYSRIRLILNSSTSICQ